MVELFNVERAAADKAPIRNGIGIASEAPIAGYTGTRARATYTCVGDTVNLAARRGSHTMQVPHEILADAATLDGGIEGATITPVGAVVFKSKSIAVEVFAVGRL